MNLETMNGIELLKVEHERIAEVINAFKATIAKLRSDSNISKETLNDFLEFFKLYTDNVHHGKEEEILFPAAYKYGMKNRSGSRCTFFFELFLESNDLSEITKDIEESNLVIAPYELRNTLKEIVDNNSPLCIPLEEHKFAYYSMQVMNMELRKCADNDWKPALFLRTAMRYINMLELHIKKEDECLFPVLRDMFSQETHKEIVKMFNDFDVEHKNEIERSNQLYQCLVK